MLQRRMLQRRMLNIVFQLKEHQATCRMHAIGWLFLFDAGIHLHYPKLGRSVRLVASNMEWDIKKHNVFFEDYHNPSELWSNKIIAMKTKQFTLYFSTNCKKNCSSPVKKGKWFASELFFFTVFLQFSTITKYENAAVGCKGMMRQSDLKLPQINWLRRILKTYRWSACDTWPHELHATFFKPCSMMAYLLNKPH